MWEEWHRKVSKNEMAMQIQRKATERNEKFVYLFFSPHNCFFLAAQSSQEQIFAAESFDKGKKRETRWM